MLKKFTAFLIKAATNYCCFEKVYVTALTINFRNLLFNGRVPNNSLRNFDRGSFDRNSVDQNCVLSVDRNFHNQLTEFF
jgi:hypothetical protein